MDSPKKLLYLEQLQLLLWKNFVVQKRSIIGLLLKLTIPAVFAIVFIPLRLLVKSNSYVNDTTFNSFEVDAFSNHLHLHRNSTFSYCPNTSQLANRIMSQTASLLNLEVACKKISNQNLLTNM